MGLRSCRTLSPRRLLYLLLIGIALLTYTMLIAYFSPIHPTKDNFPFSDENIDVLPVKERAIRDGLPTSSPVVANHGVAVVDVFEVNTFGLTKNEQQQNRKVREKTNWRQDEQEGCRPINTRLYPFCKAKYWYVKTLWRDKCFKGMHGIDGSDCAVMYYLRELEPYCWHNASYIVRQLKSHQEEKMEFKDGLDGLLKILSHELFGWLRMRATQMWPAWKDTVASLRRNPDIPRKRKKKKVLFYMGSMGYEPNFLRYAGHGGPVGELVQWTDTIASTYILGHDVTVIFNTSQLVDVAKGSVNGCVPANPADNLSDYDLIFTDVNGFVLMRIVLGGAVIAHYRCKLRFLDSFGTDPEFNFNGYRLPIPGGPSNWGTMDVQLKQIMTMYPHSPDNSFLGFVVGNVEKENIPKKKNQAVVYGKLASYFHGHWEYLDVVRKYFEVHATAAGSAHDMPDYVVKHGILDSKGLKTLLQESKVFIGLGFPYEGPGPLDAIGAGMVYINPKFREPKNRLNEKFFKSKPTLRKVTSQNPYMEDFVGEPYVYTIDIKDFANLEKILQKIKEEDDLKPFIPHEYTNTGMAERLHSFLEHQDFCDENAPPWPPVSSQQLFLSQRGQSCKALCMSKGLICESSYFYNLNSAKHLSEHGNDCAKTITSQLLFAPSYNHVNSTCHIQSDSLLFSCVAEHEAHTRLCPCRDYIKHQTALCQNCM